MSVHSSLFGNSADFGASLTASAAKAAQRFSPIRFPRISQISKKHFESRSFFVLLLMAVLLLTALTPAAVRADDIILGSGVITTGNQVYFGYYKFSNYDEEPVLWRVMGADNNKDETSTHGMLLLSEEILDTILFNQPDDDAVTNDWQNSLARNWCREFYSSIFTPVERSAVIMTSKKDELYSGKNAKYGISKLVEDFVFFLSAEETEKIYFPYDDDSSRIAESADSWWWLRSPDAIRTDKVGAVISDGKVGLSIESNELGARPAFNLNLSSVLFSSLIPSSSNQYKLTLKDSALTITPANMTRSGDVITVSYSISGTNAGAGTKAYVLVTDKAYTKSGAAVLAYTELAPGTEAGTGSFTLNRSWGTDYKVYLLAVNEGGKKKTDAASTPAAITIPALKTDQTVNPPEAVSNLIYSKSSQTLVSAAEVTAGNTASGSIFYSLDNSTWSNDLPQGTDAGTYSVWYKAAGNDSYNEYVCSTPVSVTIATADPDTPSGRTATYGQTLAEVKLPDDWTWVNSSESVGDAGTKTFPANYTNPDSDKNHHSKSNVEVSVEVGQKEVTVTADNKEMLEGDEFPRLSATVEGTINGDTVSYTLSREGDGSVGNHTIKVTGEPSQGNYTVKFVNGTLKISAKAAAPNTTPPVEADGWTEDGDEHALLKSAGSSAGGTYWYKVNEGEWTSDPASLKAKTAGTYTISYYIKGEGVYKDNGSETEPLGLLTVTVADKGTPQITTDPTAAENLVANGTDQNLLAASIEAEGGTVMYSVNGGEWSDRVPTASEAGSYEIAYYIKGDKTHTDSGSPENPLGIVTVTIADKDTPQITTEPTAAEDLVANGTDQVLITAGQADDGTVMYSVNGGEWSDQVPTASEAGNYEVSWYIKGDNTHADNGSPEKPLGTVTVVIADEPMDLEIKFVFIKGSGSRGVPIDVKETKLSPSVNIKDGKNTVSQTGSLELTFSGGDKEASVTATFSKKLKDLAPGKYSVSVSGLQKTIEFRDLDGNPAKYKLSAKAEINKKDGDIVITVYLIFKDQTAPEEPLVVRDLPEDEIGSYWIMEDGTKEYLLFHTYDICMAWLGSDVLCRGPERCYHK